MPELGLTLFPDPQHQDGDHAENADSPLHREGSASCSLDSPLSRRLLQTSGKENHAEEKPDPESSVSVSPLALNNPCQVLRPLQKPNPKDPSDKCLRQNAPNSDRSLAPVLALTSNHTIPKPHPRYPSSFHSPPLTHNVPRSSTHHSPCQGDGASDLVEKLSEKPGKPPQKGPNYDATNQETRDGDGSLGKTLGGRTTLSTDSKRRDGSLYRSGDSQLREEGNVDREPAAAETESSLLAKGSRERPQEAEVSRLLSLSKGPVPTNIVDLPPSTQIQEGQIKARGPTPRGPSTHTLQPHGSRPHNALNQTSTQAKAVETALPSKYKSMNSRHLNPRSTCESSFFYLPSTPGLHNRLNFSHSIIMATSNNNHQEAARSTAMNPPYPNQQYSRTPAMPNLNYSVPSMPPFYRPQYHYSPHAPGRPFVPASGYMVPAMAPYHQSTQYYNMHPSGFASMPYSNYRVPAMTTSIPPQQHDICPNPGFAVMAASNDRAPTMQNTAVRTVTSGYINPALLTLARPLSPSPPPSGSKQPAITIDLTLDDDNADDQKPEKSAKPKSDSPPTIIITTTSPAAAVAAAEKFPKEATLTITTAATDQQLLKEATPTTPTAPSSSASPPPSTTEAAAPKPKYFGKRTYDWLQPTSLLADLPNSKKVRMSAQESSFRQRYEIQAANSTACHFLGVKPAPPQGAVAGNWMSSSSSEGLLGSASASSGAEASMAPEKKKKEKNEGVLKKKENAWKNGDELETAENKDDDGDDNDMVAQIEAAFDEEETTESKEDEEDDDDLAALIEASFDAEEEGNEEGEKEMALEETDVSQYLIPVDEKVGDSGDLEIDDNPAPVGRSQPMSQGATV